MKKYYQPELTDKFLNEHPDFMSFFVFDSLTLAKKVFPNSKIIKYSDDDIEKPTYVDYMYHRSVYNIDIKPLEILFSKKLGTKIEFTSRIINPMKVDRLVIQSQDIVTKTGLFTLPLAYAEISSFGGGVVNKDGKMWLSFNIAFKHKNGGSNGLKIADVYYDFNKKIKERWTIVFVDDKK